jgi:hypothetical protein
VGMGGYGGGGTTSRTRMLEVVQGLCVKTSAGADGNEQAVSVVFVRQARQHYSGSRDMVTVCTTKASTVATRSCDCYTSRVCNSNKLVDDEVTIVPIDSAVMRPLVVLASVRCCGSWWPWW